MLHRKKNPWIRNRPADRRPHFPLPPFFFPFHKGIESGNDWAGKKMNKGDAMQWGKGRKEVGVEITKDAKPLCCRTSLNYTSLHENLCLTLRILPPKRKNERQTLDKNTWNQLVNLIIPTYSSLFPSISIQHLTREEGRKEWVNGSWLTAVVGNRGGNKRGTRFYVPRSSKAPFFIWTHVGSDVCPNLVIKLCQFYSSFFDVTFLFPPTLKTKEKNSSYFFRAPAPISSPSCKRCLFPLKKKQGKKPSRVKRKEAFFVGLSRENNLPGSATFFLSCQCLQRRRLLLFGLRQRTNKKRFSKPHL